MSIGEIKALARRRRLTGQELGRLKVSDVAARFKEGKQGLLPKGIVSSEKLEALRLKLVGAEKEEAIYHAFLRINDWLVTKYNIGRTAYMHCVYEIDTIDNLVERAEQAERIYRYIAELPRIMTEKQYQDMQEEMFAKHHAAKDEVEGLFELLLDGIDYYLNQLTRRPRAKNPLKAIRKRYKHEQTNSPVVLSKYNEVVGRGFYEYKGIRSDRVSASQWKKNCSGIIDEIGKDLSLSAAVRNYLVEAISHRECVVTTNRLLETYPKMEKYLADCKWSFYPDPPEALTKWEVVNDSVKLCRIYNPSGTEDSYLDDSYTERVKDFVQEFPELTAAMLSDMSTRYRETFKIDLASLPVEEWKTIKIDADTKYLIDFYGEQDFIDGDFPLFWNDDLVRRNGIAIIRSIADSGVSARIDEKGYYNAPDVAELQAEVLEMYFKETEGSEALRDRLHESWEMLRAGIYLLKGLDIALDMIEKAYGIAGLSVYNGSLQEIEESVERLNDSIRKLYIQIDNTQYLDEKLKNQKLKTIKEILPMFNMDEIQVPPENVQEAEAMLNNFQAFFGGADKFYKLLFIM